MKTLTLFCLLLVLVSCGGGKGSGGGAGAGGRGTDTVQEGEFSRQVSALSEKLKGLWQVLHKEESSPWNRASADVESAFGRGMKFALMADAKELGLDDEKLE